VNFDLPDNLFVRNRLSQSGPLEFRLAGPFQDELLADFSRGAPPALPAPAHSALDEAGALAGYFGKLAGNAQACEALEPHLMPLVRRLSSLAQRSPSGSIAAILLCPWENYAAHHAVYTALLLSRMCTALEVDGKDSDTLMLAALTMNLGTMALHNEMAHQSTPPSSQQRQLIDAHPLIGSAMARAGELTDPMLHTILLTHHERLDGKGYPFYLPAEAIEPLAHLLHLIDVTIAKLMPHGYRNAIPAHNALAEAYTGSQEKFDPGYAAQLVKALGIYPPGSFVELESGETALVVTHSEQSNAPLVATLANRYDLIDTAEPGRRITRSVPVKMQERFLPFLAPLWSLR
jgi:hypothetical protein